MTVRFPRTSNLSSWLACCLCLLLTLLAACGDYCLFCEGQGSGGGGNGGSGEEICDSAFPGLAAYGLILEDGIIDTISQEQDADDRLSLAVLPKGMAFSYPPDLDTQSAVAGDVILADQQDETIFIYDFDQSNAKRAFLTDYGQVSGLALLHVEEEGGPTYDLLFFTVNVQDSLYVYDLTGSSPASIVGNPFQITNELAGSGFFESPTALAVHMDQDTAALFVLNEKEGDSSVKRLSLDLTLPAWIPSATRTLATMNTSNHRLVDLTIDSQTDTLFVSKKLIIDGVGGWVYDIPNASTTTQRVNLDTADFFIQRGQRVTGLTVASTNKTGTTSDLLLLRENIAEAQVESYDPGVGGQTPESAYTPTSDFDFLQVIEYDCTNERLLMTDVPFNDDRDRRFFEAFPTQ
jgi:hypothetical protein